MTHPVICARLSRFFSFFPEGPGGGRDGMLDGMTHQEGVSPRMSHVLNDSPSGAGAGQPDALSSRTSFDVMNADLSQIEGCGAEIDEACIGIGDTRHWAHDVFDTAATAAATATAAAAATPPAAAAGTASTGRGITTISGGGGGGGGATTRSLKRKYGKFILLWFVAHSLSPTSEHAFFNNNIILFWGIYIADTSLLQARQTQYRHA